MTVSPAQSRLVLNEVLFSLAASPSTSRDMEIFRAVLQEAFQKSSLSRFSQTPAQDFVLSRIAYRESLVFPLTSETMKLNEALRRKLSDFSTAEIEKELDVIIKARAWVEMKENQLQQQSRFNEWLEVMKRKYQFRTKSAGFK